MDTRCGAAMTLAMPCIIGMLFVYVFGAPNLSTIKTLLPELEIIEITNPLLAQNNMFGNMTLQIETLAFAGALGQQTCNNIASINSGDSKLECTTTSVTKSKPQEDIVLCSTNVVCIVDNEITGLQNILMKFPTAFQKFKWNVKPGKEWYNTQTEIYSVLVSKTKEIFSGTEIAPTELNFGVVRGKLSDNTTRKTIHNIVSVNKTDFGLQLTWRGSNLQQSQEGPSTPFHYVDFKFAVAENVFNVELRDDKDLIALFTAVLTFFLSIMSAMKMLKTHGARGVDKALQIQSEKNGTDIPEDVLRRQRVLDEHNLTAKGTRRLSSVRNVLQRLDDVDGEEDMEVVDFDDDNGDDDEMVVKKKNWKPNPLSMGSSMEVEMTEVGLVPRDGSNNSAIKNKKKKVVRKRMELMTKNENMVTKKEMEQQLLQVKKQMKLQKQHMKQEMTQQKQEMTQQMKQQMKQETQEKQQMKQETQQMKQQMERVEREKQEMQKQIHEMQQMFKKLNKE